MNHEEDNQPIVFGEHNMCAEKLSISNIAGYFPWTKYFNDLGFSGTYPALLYTNKEADALYETVSSILGQWIVDGDPQIDVRLDFQDNAKGEPEGDLCVKISTQCRDNETLLAARVSMAKMCQYLLEASVMWVADQEAYGTIVRYAEKNTSCKPTKEGWQLVGEWILVAESALD